MNPIKLCINRQSRELVAFNGSATDIPPLFQSNVQDFQVQIVDPDPTQPLTGFIAVDGQGWGLRMSVGGTPAGTPGQVPIALQDTWTWDPTNKWFTASLALNTAAIDSYLGSMASSAAYFEINSTSGGNRTTLLQSQILLLAVIDEQTTSPPGPVNSYLTKAECLALFAQLLGTPGTHIRLTSPGSIYARELGVNDDGSTIDNIIKL